MMNARFCESTGRIEQATHGVDGLVQMACALALVFTSFSSVADSWVFGGRVKITWVMQWETEGAPTFFQLSTGQRCYVPAEDKKNYALIQLLYTTQRTADVHCYPQSYNYGGESAYKIHRIIAYAE